jgi:hypothetical protein
LRCKDDQHDLRIGDKFIDEIDTAIRIREKVVLVLSENSIKSVWVEDEVTTAHEEERKRGTTVLFPIRLDDAVVETKEAWAAKLRARHIGDFSQWKNHDDYQRTLQRVLRDSPRRNSHKSKRFLRGESSRGAPRSLLGHPGKLRGTTRFTAGC